MIDELYSINVNLDHVRTEQCDQTKYLEENKKKTDDIATKSMIIKRLSKNSIKITNSFHNSNDSDLLTKRQQNLSFVYSKGDNFESSKSTTDNAFNRPIVQINSDTITSPNRFSQLQNYELSKNEDDNHANTSTNFELNSWKNSTVKRKLPNKRPPVVINQIPENQEDFTRFCKVNGEKPYSNAAKNKYNSNIKFLEIYLEGSG